MPYRKTLFFFTIIFYNQYNRDDESYKERGKEMKFNERLNVYFEELGCTAKEVSELSGISQSTLSRYRSGERVPDADSDLFGKLCSALASFANGRESMTADSISADLLSCEDICTVDFDIVRLNFNTLVLSLGISISDLGKYMNYDASTLFRIRNGTRHPSDPDAFVSSVVGYVACEAENEEMRFALAGLFGCEASELSDISRRSSAIRDWLTSAHGGRDAEVTRFLSKLNDFDLNEYIKAIRFDELKVPTFPLSFPTTKFYRGLDQMMEAEIDFLKATVLSRSKADVTMYSDMPMTEMSKDPEFPKKWMFGMAMLLKKGLHLNMIHNVDRPFSEMMLGLESYIPMYMTGQISPYYLKGIRSGNFLHLLKTSGAAALAGEAISGNHAGGIYRLMKSRENVAAYNDLARDLLAKALPLMEIYGENDIPALRSFLTADASLPGKRRNILPSLPVWTADRPFLEKFLSSRNIGEEERARILLSVEEQRSRTEQMMKNGSVRDEIPIVTREEFDEYPLPFTVFGTAGTFNAVYTYDEYLEHLAMTEKFAAERPEYSLFKNPACVFRNLSICIREGNLVMISKVRAPSIHFVIRHPRLREAIENFAPPLVESDR